MTFLKQSFGQNIVSPVYFGLEHVVFFSLPSSTPGCVCLTVTSSVCHVLWLVPLYHVSKILLFDWLGNKVAPITTTTISKKLASLSLIVVEWLFVRGGFVVRVQVIESQINHSIFLSFCLLNFLFRWVHDRSKRGLQQRCCRSLLWFREAGNLCKP